MSSLTPLVGPRFQSLSSKATLPRAGFLPSFQANADPVKSLSNPFEFLSQSLLSLSLSLSIRPSFLSWHAGRVLCRLWFLFSASESPFLAMLLLHVLSFLGWYAGRVPCGLCSSCLNYSVRLWVTDLNSLSLSLRLQIYTDTTSSLPRQESTR